MDDEHHEQPTYEQGGSFEDAARDVQQCGDDEGRQLGTGGGEGGGGGGRQARNGKLHAEDVAEGQTAPSEGASAATLLPDVPSQAALTGAY